MQKSTQIGKENPTMTGRRRMPLDLVEAAAWACSKAIRTLPAKPSHGVVSRSSSPYKYRLHTTPEPPTRKTCHSEAMAAAKLSTSVAFFLALSLLFLTLTNVRGLCPVPKPPPSPPPPSPKPASDKCPVDTLKFAACANVLNGLISFEIGTPPKKPCCSLVGGLADAEAALCLCTALKADVLGLNLNIPISLSLLVNYCGKEVPAGFQCP
ncbi:hypothetical protein B296_00046321 [Ensete ventricosum]|uniref:Bifunctional inhibitor/plant lipid transfer protein/seed storage helical domain-containing protein n=1 Tax=Ensete ventricosum TaxID=4639 RepID=A0A426Z296_ENSVE|nr:hypothetical protein B296_00046321 [Ensete ventricosum]